MKGETFLKLILIIGFLAVSIGVTVMAVSDDDSPRRALTSMGFTNVNIGESSMLGEWYGCAKDEISHQATATNPAGIRVSVVVCCGAILKGCTVRTK